MSWKDESRNIKPTQYALIYHTTQTLSVCLLSLTHTQTTINNGHHIQQEQRSKPALFPPLYWAPVCV